MQRASWGRGALPGPTKISHVQRAPRVPGPTRLFAERPLTSRDNTIDRREGEGPQAASPCTKIPRPGPGLLSPPPSRAPAFSPRLSPSGPPHPTHSNQKRGDGPALHGAQLAAAQRLFSPTLPFPFHPTGAQAADPPTRPLIATAAVALTGATAAPSLCEAARYVPPAECFRGASSSSAPSPVAVAAAAAAPAFACRFLLAARQCAGPCEEAPRDHRGFECTVSPCCFLKGYPGWKPLMVTQFCYLRSCLDDGFDELSG